MMVESRFVRRRLTTGNWSACDAQNHAPDFLIAPHSFLIAGGASTESFAEKFTMGLAPHGRSQKCHGSH
jgi:hypothetical protein